MEHYSIVINNSNTIAIQINPAAFKFKAFSGKPSKDAIVAFDVNYSWGPLAIGLVKSEGSYWATIESKKEIRPCLCIRDDAICSIKKPKYVESFDRYPVVMQAGPTLVWYNKDVSDLTKEQEGFKDDATRRADHVAVGATKYGRLIVVYKKQASLEDLAKLFLNLQCAWAMKCDGGSKSYLALHQKNM